MTPDTEIVYTNSMKKLTKEDILSAVERVQQEGKTLSYAELSRHLPKNQRTGKSYSREFIRQMLRTFPEGIQLYAELSLKYVITHDNLPPIIIIDSFGLSPFVGVEGEHQYSTQLTPQKIAGRVVYGDLPVSLASYAKYIVVKSVDGTVYEFRVTKNSRANS